MNLRIYKGHIIIYVAFFAVTPVAFIGKLPWKYEWDFESYLLNVLAAWIVYPSLYFFLRLFLVSKSRLYVLYLLGGVYVMHIFPIRAFSKIVYGELPPNYLSGFLGLFLPILYFYIIKRRLNKN